MTYINKIQCPRCSLFISELQYKGEFDAFVCPECKQAILNPKSSFHAFADKKQGDELSEEEKLVMNDLEESETKRCPSCDGKLRNTAAEKIDYVCEQCQRDWCVRDSKLYSPEEAKAWDENYNHQENLATGN